MQVIQQLRRHGPRERRLGGGGPVTRVAEQPHFILQLDHDHGVLPGIHFAEMLHEGRIGAGVSLQVGLAERGEYFHRLAVLEPGAREPLLVGFHPFGREAGETVLPTAEPEEDNVQIIFPRTSEQAINKGEIVFAFYRLDPVPPDTHEDGVQVHFNELRPYRVHVLEAGRSGVVRFTGQNQKRLAVNNQLCGGTPLLQVGNGQAGCDCLGLGVRCRQCQRKDRGQAIECS